MPGKTLTSQHGTYHHATLKQIFFEGITLEGDSIHASRFVTNHSELKKQLASENIVLIKIKRNPKQIIFKLSTKQLYDCVHKLALMIDAKLSLTDAIGLLETQTSHKHTQRLLAHMLEELNQGKSFLTICHAHPYLFDTTLTSFIRSADTTGNLADALNQAYAHYLQQQQLTAQIKKACTYPAIVLIIAFAITTGLLVFIVPKFSELYQNLGSSLPAATQMLVSLSKQLPMFLGTLSLVVTLIGILHYYASTNIPGYQRRYHRCICRLPGVRQLIHAHTMITWYQLNASLLSQGVTLHDSLCLSVQGIHNRYYRQQLSSISDAIAQGSSLSDAIVSILVLSSYDQHWLQLSDTGHNTGDLFDTLAIHHQVQLKRWVDTLCELLEPALMLFLAIIIGGIILMLYLPIFRMGSVM